MNINLSIEEAIKEVEKLENDKEFWSNRKTHIESLVLPGAINFDNIKVDGGMRTNVLDKYAEIEDYYKIEDTLKYINNKLDDLYKWLAQELKILNKYGDVEKQLIILKEQTFITDSKTGKTRHLKWYEIADILHYSTRMLQYMYSKIKKERRKLKNETNN